MYTNETWLPVADFPDYQVSDMGRVRSWRRLQPTSARPVTPRMLKPVPQSGGYLRLSLQVPKTTGVTCSRLVHRLVMEAFVGPRPGPDNKVHICHNDSDPTNNRLSNLRYDTTFANVADQIALGTHPSIAARAKTHCKRGHEYTDITLGWNRSGPRPTRFCRACVAICKAIRGQRRRDAA